MFSVKMILRNKLPEPLWASALSALALVVGLATARAQEEKHKISGFEEKVMAGTGRQAFSGKVRSLDLDHKILHVDTVEGGATESFPLKKGVEVVMASGAKHDLSSLKPGINVLIYYEQKGDRRTVKQIVILAAKPTAEKKPPPPS
jgi:Cu/Ag efflux protein CusF